MIDLTVLGAGLSGLTAAIRAAEMGLRVKLIAKGHGATHWHAGSVDLYGYDRFNQPIDQPLQEIAVLPENHPYQLTAVDTIQQALERLAGWLAEENLPYQQPQTINYLLPTAAGAIRPAWLTPLAQLAGDCHDRTPMLIVGFDHLRDFYPELIAQNLMRQGIPARAVRLPLSLISDQLDRTPVQLAVLLENPERLTALGLRLKQLLRKDERLGLPAILGINGHHKVLGQLDAILQRPFFEIPSLPPSLPGLRLFNALAGRFKRLGGQIELGMEATSFTAESGQITAVYTATSARPLRHKSRHYLLATGGLLGGGLFAERSGVVREMVFDLPVDIPTERSDWLNPLFLAPEGHPVFKGGIPLNKQWCPVDHAGLPIYNNLSAAGNLLAGFDGIRERSSEGVAVVSGMLAAEAAVNQLQVGVK